METPPSFFKVMVGDDFKTSLRIPPQFKKRHIVDAARWRGSFLRGAGGRRWKVEAEVEGGDVFLRGGWGRFVSDHEIAFGDFLVFFYDGNVGFDVKVYGATGCEKLDCCPPPPDVKMEDSDDGEKPAAWFQRGSPAGSRKRKGCERRSRAKKSIKWSEDNAALKMACAFNPPNPHFVTTCRKSYVTVPAELVKKCNLDEKDSVVLRDPRGISSSVKLTTWQDGRLCLSSGWRKFYRKNGLKERDACILEFVQGGDVIDVHMYRAADRDTNKSKKPSVRPLTEGDQEVNPNAGKSFASPRTEGNKEVTPTAGKSFASPLTEGNKEVTPNAGKSSVSSFSKIIMRDRVTLNEDDKKRILNAARSFESSHPKFMMVWRLSRLYHVPIPKKLAEEVGLRGNQTTNLIDPSGNSWPVNITIRSYGQVELGIGWSRFSRGNTLAPGDVCAFEFFSGPDAIKVHIIRAEETSSSAAGDAPAPETP